MDWPGSAAGGCRASSNTLDCVCFGFIVGHYLFLWLVLVADVPDDSLRPPSCVARVPSSDFSGPAGRCLPCPDLCFLSSFDFAVWIKRSACCTLHLDFPGGSTIWNYRTSLEHDWLFTGVSPVAYSISSMGRCVRGRVYSPAREFRNCLRFVALHHCLGAGFALAADFDRRLYGDSYSFTQARTEQQDEHAHSCHSAERADGRD